MFVYIWASFELAHKHRMASGLVSDKIGGNKFSSSHMDGVSATRGPDQVVTCRNQKTVIRSFIIHTVITQHKCTYTCMPHDKSTSNYPENQASERAIDRYKSV